MAVVTLRFEDVVGGPMDGSSRFEFEFDPPFEMRDGRPVNLTPAQAQGLVAVGAMTEMFDVLQPGKQKEGGIDAPC